MCVIVSNPPQRHGVHNLVTEMLMSCNSLLYADGACLDQDSLIWPLAINDGCFEA